MYARFTHLTQSEGRIQQLPPPPVTQWSTAGRRLSLCRCNNGQGIEGGTVGAFWCITFISPRGTLARDATMRSDTSSLFVVAVQENLPPTLDPMNMGFHPLSRRILPCRVHRSVHPSSLLPVSIRWKLLLDAREGSRWVVELKQSRLGNDHIVEISFERNLT